MHLPDLSHLHESTSTDGPKRSAWLGPPTPPIFKRRPNQPHRERNLGEYDGTPEERLSSNMKRFLLQEGVSQVFTAVLMQEPIEMSVLSQWPGSVRLDELLQKHRRAYDKLGNEKLRTKVPGVDNVDILRSNEQSKQAQQRHRLVTALELRGMLLRANVEWQGGQWGGPR